MKTRISLLILLIIATVACHRRTCNFMVLHPLSCEVDMVPSNTIDTLSGLEHTDSMNMNVLLDGIIAESCSSFPQFSLGGEAMAFMAMRTGLDKPLKSFEISSNHAFNDIPAGQSLKNKLWGMSYMGANKQSVDEVLQPYMDNKTVQITPFYGFFFQFREKPQILEHTFKVVITFTDGRVFEVNTDNTVWK